jgi:hypothetical protein
LRIDTTESPALHRISPVEQPQFVPFILSRPEIGELIRYLRCRYDWVVVDTPSITSAKDSIILASLVDAVFLVVRHSFIDKRIVQSSMASLSQTNPKHFSKIINDFGTNLPGMNSGCYVKKEFSTTDRSRGILEPLQVTIPGGIRRMYTSKGRPNIL